MTKKKVRVRAIVVVTLEIPVDDCWGGDCPLSQVHEQAVDSMQGLLRTSVEGNSGTGKQPTLPKGTRIVGDPLVRSIITEENVDG